MVKSVSPPISSERPERMKEMFRKALGRELSPEEQRYLGLAAAAESVEIEPQDQEPEAEPFKRAKSA